jgi:hypothetical protein
VLPAKPNSDMDGAWSMPKPADPWNSKPQTQQVPNDPWNGKSVEKAPLDPWAPVKDNGAAASGVSRAICDENSSRSFAFAVPPAN